MHRLRSILVEFLTLGTFGLSAVEIASLVGAGTSVYSSTRSHGSGAPGGSGGNAYVPQGQGSADSLWQQIMQQFGGRAANDFTNVGDYLGGELSRGEGSAAGLSGRLDGFGDLLSGEAGRFFGAQGDLMGAGRDVFKTAMDPENALHDRMLHDVTQGSREATSVRGIGMSPEAANLESQAGSNFNIDWQNQQLQRQLSGLQGMGGAYNEAGRQGQAGGAALAGAQGMYTGAMQLPFNLANWYTGAMGGIYNPLNAMQGNLAQYMGLGQSGSQAAFGQGQYNLNNLTSGLTTLGNQPWLQNYFNGGGGGSGGTTYPTDSGGQLQFDP